MASYVEHEEKTRADRLARDACMLRGQIDVLEQQLREANAIVNDAPISPLCADWIRRRAEYFERWTGPRPKGVAYAALLSALREYGLLTDADDEEESEPAHARTPPDGRPEVMIHTRIYRAVHDVLPLVENVGNARNTMRTEIPPGACFVEVTASTVGVDMPAPAADATGLRLLEITDLLRAHRWDDARRLAIRTDARAPRDLDICARPKCESPRHYNIHDPERGGHAFVEASGSSTAPSIHGPVYFCPADECGLAAGHDGACNKAGRSEASGSSTGEAPATQASPETIAFVERATRNLPELAARPHPFLGHNADSIRCAISFDGGRTECGQFRGDAIHIVVVPPAAPEPAPAPLFPGVPAGGLEELRRLATASVDGLERRVNTLRKDVEHLIRIRNEERVADRLEVLQKLVLALAPQAHPYEAHPDGSGGCMKCGGLTNAIHPMHLADCPNGKVVVVSSDDAPTVYKQEGRCTCPDKELPHLLALATPPPVEVPRPAGAEPLDHAYVSRGDELDITGCWYWDPKTGKHCSRPRDAHSMTEPSERVRRKLPSKAACPFCRRAFGAPDRVLIPAKTGSEVRLVAQTKRQGSGTFVELYLERDDDGMPAPQRRSRVWHHIHACEAVENEQPETPETVG